MNDLSDKKDLCYLKTNIEFKDFICTKSSYPTNLNENKQTCHLIASITSNPKIRTIALSKKISG